jgi:hypothetical protein
MLSLHDNLSKLAKQYLRLSEIRMTSYASLNFKKTSLIKFIYLAELIEKNIQCARVNSRIGLWLW